MPMAARTAAREPKVRARMARRRLEDRRSMICSSKECDVVNGKGGIELRDGGSHGIGEGGGIGGSTEIVVRLLSPRLR